MRKKYYRKKKRGPVVSKKVEYDGITFASGLEKYMYIALKEAGIRAKYEGETFVLLNGFHFENEAYERQANSKGIFKNLDTFAAGGRPTVGQPSIVGEKGPELFVPSRAGTIIPNNQLGGQSVTNNIVVNVDVDGGVDAQGGEEQGRQLGRLIAVAVQSEIIQQKRAGGLLA